jgi:hypothetical protein|nr:MAG: hypothetical protein [Bacteriophage sp.]
MPDRKEIDMESYVERWKREQEEAKQKEVQKDNGRREEDGQTEGKPGQKAQKNRRVSRKQS